MPDFLVDRRDLDFVLFEQFDLMGLKGYGPYADFDREDYDAILDQAIKLIGDVLWPSFAVADREGCRIEDGEVKVPEIYRDVFKQWSEGGWIGMARPPEMGGMGLPLPLSVLVTELAIAAASSFIFYPGLGSAAGSLLENFASEKLRDIIVPRYYSGEWAGTMCLTESQAGTSVGDLTTTATPIDGSDLYSIKGNKIFISSGDHDLSKNIVHLVLARVPGDPEGTKGISLFAVPKYRFDDNGKLGDKNDVAVTAIEEKMGIHGSPTCSLSFGDNDACQGHLIGERCQGIIYMFQMMNEARIVCGIQGSATANLCFQWALAYARERVQGTKVTSRSTDKVSIIEHPDVRRNLMLCKAWAEGIRALLVQTAFYETWAHHHEDEAQRVRYQDLVDLMTPICKAYATDTGFEVSEIAMQIHGGYGYIKEYGVEQAMRDTKIASIYEGTNGVQALDLLGRKMRLKDGALFMTWMMGANELIEAHKSHEVLSKEFEALEKAKNHLGQTAMNFGAQAKENPELPLLGATPFLRMFGHVEVARLLLEQAVVAHEKLQTRMKDKGAGDLGAFLKDDELGRYYDGKVKTARFFVHAVLPEATAIAKSIQAGDTSALEILL